MKRVKNDKKTIFHFLFIIIGNPEFYSKLAEEFISRGHRVGIISGALEEHRNNEEKIIKNVPYFHINDLISRYQDKIKYDDDTIKQIKEKYDIPCLHRFYFPHFYYRKSYCGYVDFYEMSNHSESGVLFKKTIETFQAIEYFLEENSVKYTVQNLGEEILRRVVYHHNKKFNIPNVIISWTPLPEHYALISNEIGRWDELELKRYDELSPSEVKEALDFINSFRNRGTTIKLRELKNENIFKRFVNYLIEQRRNKGFLPAIRLTYKTAFNEVKKKDFIPPFIQITRVKCQILFLSVALSRRVQINIARPALLEAGVYSGVRCPFFTRRL